MRDEKAEDLRTNIQELEEQLASKQRECEERKAEARKLAEELVRSSEENSTLSDILTEKTSDMNRSVLVFDCSYLKKTSVYCGISVSAFYIFFQTRLHVYIAVSPCEPARVCYRVFLDVFVGT